MFQNPCDVHITFVSLVIPCFLLLGSHSGPIPGLPCKTAAMQNGSLGVRCDCTHTSHPRGMLLCVDICVAHLCVNDYWESLQLAYKVWGRYAPHGAQMLAKKQQRICHFLANISMDQKSSHHPHPEVMHAMSLLDLHVLICGEFGCRLNKIF